MMFFLFGTLSVMILLCFLLFSKNQSMNYWESRNVPFYRPESYLKSIWSLIMKDELILDKLKFLYYKYKNSPYVGIMILNKPVLIVTSPELIKTILIRDFDYFMNRNTNIKESVDPLIYNTIFFAKDNTWRSVRAKLSPTFSSGKMKYMFPLKKACVSNLLRYFEAHDDTVLEMKELIKRFAVDLVSSCAFGIDSEAIFNEKSEIFAMSKKLLDLSSLRTNISLLSYFFFPQIANFFKMKGGNAKAMDYFTDLFVKNRRQREEMKISRPDLIEMMNNLNQENDDGYVFDDIKMASQALTFFLAGSDTTAMTVSLMLYEMVMNPEIQERVRKEVSGVDDITYESLQEMKYLDMVFQETLRKYPIGAFMLRESTRKYVFDETGLVLDKNTLIILGNTPFLSDPEYFPNPDKFDPERFSKDNIHKIKPFTFLPFGDGPRNCIGKRFATIAVKLAFAASIKNFTFEKCHLTQERIKINSVSAILESQDGIYLKIIKIEKSQ